MSSSHALLLTVALFSIAMNAGVLPDNEDEKLSDRSSKGGWLKADHRLKESDYCVVNCFSASQIPEPVRNFFFEVYDDVFVRETNLRRIFNVTMLNWYCGYGNERQQCVLKCNNDSFYRRELLKILKPTSYICNETDFVGNAECYREVYEQDLDECESGDKCLPYKKAMINLIRQRSPETGSVSRDEQDAQNFFSNLCQYVICGNQCRSNQLISTCGRESNEILLEFYRRVVASMKLLFVELYHFFTGHELTITDTCDQDFLKIYKII